MKVGATRQSKTNSLFHPAGHISAKAQIEQYRSISVRLSVLYISHVGIYILTLLT
jgi:hypothetical protein